jgi:hypothetical protein
LKLPVLPRMRGAKKVFKAKVRRARRAIRVLKAIRRDPSPVVDQRIFDRTWSDNGRLAPDDPTFLAGEEPHQVVYAKAILDEYDRSGRVLGALTSEAANYLVVFVMFTGLIGFATTSAVVLLADSPRGWLVVLPGASLFILLSASLVALVRSHASRLASWTTNYLGPARRVRKITTEYAYINSKRRDTMRNNRYAQRAKRMLSLVALLYVLSVTLICVAVVTALILIG